MRQRAGGGADGRRPIDGNRHAVGFPVIRATDKDQPGGRRPYPADPERAGRGNVEVRADGPSPIQFGHSADSDDSPKSDAADGTSYLCARR